MKLRGDSGNNNNNNGNGGDKSSPTSLLNEKEDSNNNKNGGEDWSSKDLSSVIVLERPQVISVGKSNDDFRKKLQDRKRNAGTRVVKKDDQLVFEKE